MRFDPTTFVITVTLAILGVILVVVWEEISYRRCKRQCFALEKEVQKLEKELKQSRDKYDGLLAMLEDINQELINLKRKVASNGSEAR